ncbi:uncharacterized protein LOC144158587 isoform X2 [Haemaphysalis longicornis]
MRFWRKHFSTERREACQMRRRYGNTMTMPLEVGRSQGVSCCQQTQATLWTATTGTQCSLKLFSSTGAQTGEEFSVCEASNSKPSVACETLRTLLLGEDNTAEASTELQENNAGSTSSHSSYTGKHFPTERREACQMQQNWGHIMTMPMEVGQSHGVSCCQLTRATVWTTTTGCEACNSQPSVACETLRTLLLGEDNTAEASTELQENNAGSTSSHSSYTGDPTNDHERISFGGQPYVCESSQRHSLIKTTFIIYETVDVNELPYTCNACKKVFAQECDLLAHSRVHTDERPYLCEICQKRFTQKGILVNHMKLHSGEKPNVCDICQKAFIKRGDLNRHRRSHSGEKPFVCGICRKRFTQKAHLVTHETSHAEYKPYSCGTCQKSFVKKNDLLRHQKLHTNLHVCGTCGMSFTKKDNLIRHEKLHTGEMVHMCDVCQTGFATKDNLVRHKKLHSGERPYVCRLCQKSFAQKDTLVGHERLHSGEKPHVCKTCQRGFAKKGNLVSHEKLHRN